MPAVTELVIAELMYLQWMDPKEPIFLYINSTGTTRDDGETVSLYMIDYVCLPSFYSSFNLIFLLYNAALLFSCDLSTVTIFSFLVDCTMLCPPQFVSFFITTYYSSVLCLSKMFGYLFVRLVWKQRVLQFMML